MLRSNSRTSSRPRLPEHLRLQSHLELMTQKLEHVRREASYLDEQIEITQSEIKRPPATDAKCQANVRTLQHKLSIEQSRLDELRAQNSRLRADVERTRKELAQSRHVVATLTRDTNHSVVSSDKTHRQAQAQAQAYNRQLKHIHLLRSKSAQFKQRYRRNLSQLHSCLREEQSIRFLANQEFQQGFKHYQGSEPVHVLGLLKDMCAHWSTKVAQAKRETDEYLRHIRQLRSSFAQVELATGINQLEAVVTSVVKSEEQLHDVTAYFSTLNAEVESMQDAYFRSLAVIEQDKETQERGTTNNQQLKENLNQQADRLNTKIQQKNAKARQIDAVLAQSIQFIQQIAQVCVEAKVLLPSAVKFDGLEGEQTTQLLGKLEEAIADAQMVTACQQQAKHPLLTRVPMALLEDKAGPVFTVEDGLVELVDDQWVNEAKYPMNLEEFREQARRISNSRTLL